MSVPVLGVVGVLTDGHKHLRALELCGGESFAAWNGCLDDLVARGLPALERKAPKHALAEIRDDFHRIVYATNAAAARRAYTVFERTWAKRCPYGARTRLSGSTKNFADA